MANQQLGRLTKVSLRQAWASESSDFTPWLAQEENLKLLSEAIGIELECEGQEKGVGPFRADILCKDTLTDDWVLIENQLERTDHSHLGQLLTYAAGLDAVSIVWIAERFTEEHRAALDWLNEHTAEKINFFGLEVELWRIGESSIAPKFNVISKPNDWSRRVQQVAANRDLNSIEQTRLKFWTAFKDHLETRGSPLRISTPSRLSWTNYPLGRSGIHLGSILSTSNSITGTYSPEMRVEVYIKTLSAKSHFAAIEKLKPEIESSLGVSLTWLKNEHARACRIYIRQDADFTNEILWPDQFEWFRNNLEKMHAVFSPIVKNIKNEESSNPT